MFLKLKIFLSAIILFSYTVFSQTDFSIGGFIGGGSFKGNSTSVGGFTTSLFAEANFPVFQEVFPRVSFVFVKDFNALLPNTKQPYNPYLLGVSFKGVTTQYFDYKIFLEEGVGLLALNDRTFSDTDVWDYGITLSISVGYDFRNFDLKGFKISIGAEYGLTFFQTLPQYSSIHLLAHYTI